MSQTIQISINNVWGYIGTPLPQQVLEYIDTKTKYHPAGYDRAWTYNHRDALGNRRWDGYNHTFNIEQQAFRRGLLRRITNALEFHGYTVAINNIANNAPPPLIDIRLQEGLLKPLAYQEEVRKHVRDNNIGIIASPTGTGKSVMMGIICDELKQRTLIVLNDLVLADQMHRNLRKYFPTIKVGYIGNSEFELGDITVATMNSLRLMLGIESRTKSKGPHAHRRELEDYLKTVGVVLHDEVHLADSESCVAVYGLFMYSPRRYGFSATPYAWAEKQQKNVNIELEQVFGHVIYSTFGLDFTALGMRVPLIVRPIEVEPRIKVYGTHRDNQAKLYAKCKEFEVTSNPAWDAAIVRMTREYTDNNATAFVYAAHSLEYGAKLAKMLDAPFIQGKTSRKERFRLFDAVQAKEIPCIVSDIGGVGLDIPSLDAFILASDSKDVRQMMGRVVRASPGKQDGHFVDLWKNCSFLAKHHELRMNQYKQEGAVIL